MISLGCAKNLVDAELMLGALLKAGVQITNEPGKADVVIVNTCGFIDSAQEESVDTILESAEVRDANSRGQALVVAGCLPQRFRTELPKLLPEVDAFMGIDQVPHVTTVIEQALAHRRARVGAPAGFSARRTSKAKVALELSRLEGAKPREADEVNSLRGTDLFGKTRIVVSAKPATASAAQLIDVSPRPKYIPEYNTPRFRLTPRHFAYVKIAEGCNHPCSFCTIPSMRGSHRSRRQEDILSEARLLVQDGVKELNLISQDSTYYGLDLRPNHSRAISSPDRFQSAVKSLHSGATTISTLVRELNTIPGDFWIRLLYTHPAHWTDELIETIAASRKVARYIDIPLQHIHENMLERMRRETSRAHIENLIKRIRSRLPGIAIRTTFIVGFPGETEDYFESLLDFIRETRFERLGIFTYSREEGTRAGQMAGQIPDKIKEARRSKAMALQQQIAREVSRSQVGRTIRVLVEREVHAKDKAHAHVTSWEHGQLRVAAEGQQMTGNRGPVYLARGEADAPDIDGRVYVRGKMKPGEFANVTVVGNSEYDLMARPALDKAASCAKVQA